MYRRPRRAALAGAALVLAAAAGGAVLPTSGAAAASGRAAHPLPGAGGAGAATAVTPLIVGGVPASTRNHPWVVALTVPGFGLFCGGTLVRPAKVVTAAHCVNFLAGLPGLVTVVAGRDVIAGSGGTEVGVSRIWVHPGFRSFSFGEETGYHDDLAVLTLTRPLPYRTLPLPGARRGAGSRNLYRPGTPARIIGWGTTGEQATDAGVLRTAVVPVVADRRCAAPAAYGQAFLPATEVCAGFLRHGGVDTCVFDSGTPLVVRGRLAGVTSWGLGCGRPGYPGIYTQVSAYLAVLARQLR